MSRSSNYFGMEDSQVMAEWNDAMRALGEAGAAPAAQPLQQQAAANMAMMNARRGKVMGRVPRNMPVAPVAPPARRPVVARTPPIIQPPPGVGTSAVYNGTLPTGGMVGPMPPGPPIVPPGYSQSPMVGADQMGPNDVFGYTPM